jgi:hypothetical protein
MSAMGKNQTIDLILGMTAAVANCTVDGPDRARQHRNAAGHGPRDALIAAIIIVAVIAGMSSRERKQ